MSRPRKDPRPAAGPASGVSRATVQRVRAAITANYRAYGTASTTCALVFALGIAADDLTRCLDELEARGLVRRTVGGSVLPMNALVSVAS